MSRTKPRNRPQVGIENLEARVVLSGGLNGQTQYMLDLLNMVRTDPRGASQWVGQGLSAITQNTISHYNVNLSNVQADIASRPAQPPLAYNNLLGQAATGHSQDQANTGIESHTGSDGSDLSTRLNRAGYTNAASSTENAFAYADSVDQAMQSFLIDWGVSNKGHLDNIMQPGTPSGQAFTEVGFGVVQTNKTNIGPLVVTQDFARPSGTPQPYILGAVFADLKHDNLDHPGEGVSNATVTFTKLDGSGRPTGPVTSVQTWDGGGYQQQLDPGFYDVKAIVNGQVVGDQKVTLGSENIEVRFDTTQAPPAPAPTPAPAAPAPTPAPAPAPAPAPVSAPVPTPVKVDSVQIPAAQTIKMSTPVEASVIVPHVALAETPIANPAGTPGSDAAPQPNILSFITHWSTWVVPASKAPF